MDLPIKKSQKVTNLQEYTYFIYGEPKVGKTTFCSNFESALFICTEPGHKFQEIYKVSPTNWTEFKDIARKLYSSKHDFKTIVIDTVDNAYTMCKDYVCKQLHINDPSDLGYGKGFNAVKSEFHSVINGLAQKGFGIIFVSHAQTNEKEVKNVKRSYTDSTLSGSARKVVSGLCDFIFYCYIDDDGTRKFRTKATPNYNAGDRTGKLPEIMNLDYKQLEQALIQ